MSPRALRPHQTVALCRFQRSAGPHPAEKGGAFGNHHLMEATQHSLRASTQVVHRLADVEQSGMRLVPCHPTGARESKQDRPGHPPRGVWQSEKGKPTSKHPEPRSGTQARPPCRHAAQRIIWFSCVHLVRAVGQASPSVGRAGRDGQSNQPGGLPAMTGLGWARVWLDGRVTLVEPSGRPAQQ